MDVNKYLSRVYQSPPCWQLVTDVMREELGVDVNRFKTVNSSVLALCAAYNQRFHKDKFGFVQMSAPANLCVVFLGKNEKFPVHHSGVYFEGGILHAVDGGVYYQDISSLSDQYGVMEFWGLPA